LKSPLPELPLIRAEGPPPTPDRLDHASLYSESKGKRVC
jgi:hypothetical protein